MEIVYYAIGLMTLLSFHTTQGVGFDIFIPISYRDMCGVSGHWSVTVNVTIAKEDAAYYQHKVVFKTNSTFFCSVDLTTCPSAQDFKPPPPTRENLCFCLVKEHRYVIGNHDSDVHMVFAKHAILQGHSDQLLQVAVPTVSKYSPMETSEILGVIPYVQEQLSNFTFRVARGGRWGNDAKPLEKVTNVSFCEGDAKVPRESVSVEVCDVKRYSHFLLKLQDKVESGRCINYVATRGMDFSEGDTYQMRFSYAEHSKFFVMANITCEFKDEHVINFINDKDACTTPVVG